MSKHPEDAPAAVEAHGLVKIFGSKRAVDGVDLSVPAGSIYSVLGPNGAGKTTTISMLATLLRPDGGTAHIFGHEVQEEPHIVRQLISVAGQYASMGETLTAMENLTILGMLLGLSRHAARTKALRLLEQFGLAGVKNRKLSRFPGGMRRRLDLATSLISQAPLICLDEPTAGLDPRTRSEMWDTIRVLAESGVTILLTTQYLDEADQLSDRIAVIDHGRVVAEGTPDELKSTVGVASLQLTFVNPEHAARAAGITERVLSTRPCMSEPRVLKAPMGDPERVTELLGVFKAAEIDLRAVSVQKPTLDDVFIAITGKAEREGRRASL